MGAYEALQAQYIHAFLIYENDATYGAAAVYMAVAEA